MLVWHKHKAKVRSLAFSPDSRHIITTAGISRYVWLWEATTGKLVRKLAARNRAMRAAIYLPDGQHVVGLSERFFATVWHVETGEAVATLETAQVNYLDTLAASPDGKRLVIYTQREFEEWNDPARPTREARRRDNSLGGGYGYPFQCGFSPAGTYFWHSGIALVLKDAKSLTEVRRLTDPDGALPAGCAFTADESRVCVAFGHRAVVWRLDEDKAQPVKLRGHKHQVRAVGFLPGGGTVLTAAMDGTVRLWDANTGAEQRSFDWGIGKVRVAAVSPDGTLCAAGGDDGHLVVWDVDR